MAGDGYVIFICLFSSLCYVVCELNLPEGSPCVTKGFNGTCVNLFNCYSAGNTYLYLNGGYPADNFPEFPDICSYKDNEPIVCCTDCSRTEPIDLRNKAVGPHGKLINKGDSIAKTKCYEYFEKLPYSCRGSTELWLRKDWREVKKCHDVKFQVPWTLGGRYALLWEFPHMALLGYGEDVESAQWLCGGSVISERFILTAAHCSSTVQQINVSFAALGLLKRTELKKHWKVYTIKRIITHPKYKAPSKYHDIALLETETEIAFGKDLLPACLNIDQGFNPTGEASGWGRTGHRKALADTLQVVILEAFEELECAAIFPPHRLMVDGYDHKKQMCYGSHTKSIDTCEGDSGGPLHHDRYGNGCLFHVIGVTSHSKDCGILGSAGMYTRVSYYVPWIESIVWPEETEAKRKKDQLWLNKWLNLSEMRK